MQLVAYGAQDIYLTGNPQITFFKVVYRRHTNFSMECIEQTLNGTVGTGASDVTATISRNGDLVCGMHLDILFNNASVTNNGTYINWTNNTGHAYIKSCEVEIGGQKIDKHYGHWLDVWNELTDKDHQEHSLINKHSAKNAYLKSGASSTTFNNLRCYVPLKFWFCRNPGLALPLIALQYHEVKVKFNFRAVKELINADGSNTAFTAAAPDVSLWCDYVYLDTDERRRFAQVSHEYLIEQLQYSDETLKTSVDLNLNHPVKELIWVGQDADAGTSTTTITSSVDATSNVQGTMANKNDYFNYMANASTHTEYVNGQASYEHFSKMNLKLNGHDRFAKRNASYFRTVTALQANHKVPEKHVYCYSFALEPEEHQPSGTCNFSRIDNAQLNFDAVLSNTDLHVYAVNYNVLRIMSGMGGLAYSN